MNIKRDTYTNYGKILLNHENWKVKVFLLNKVGDWDDCGTGILFFENQKTDISANYLKVMKLKDENHEDQNISSEKKLKLSKGMQFSDGECLLWEKIDEDLSFEKQNGNYIF